MSITANDIMISINTKMTIKMFATNNRIIIKESFAKTYIYKCINALFYIGFSKPSLTIDIKTFDGVGATLAKPLINH